MVQFISAAVLEGVHAKRADVLAARLEHFAVALHALLTFGAFERIQVARDLGEIHFDEMQI